MEKLQTLMKDFVGEKNAKTAVAFLLALDIVREASLESLIRKVVRVIFAVVDGIDGVFVLKGGEVLSGVGVKREWFQDMDLADGYVLRVYHDESLDRDTKEILEFIQALLYSHMYNLMEMERLKERAMKDALTGAYTRSAGIEILDRLAREAKRGRVLSIVFVDLDGLKRINDEYGHDAGDRYLKGFVKACRDSCREGDVVVRWGGDEFIVALPGAKRDHADKVMERIARRFNGSFSYGVSTIPFEAENVHEAVSLADRRMYENKRSKKRFTKPF